MIKRLIKNKKGVTLVELIVVLAVTTVIAATITALLMASKTQSDKATSLDKMMEEVTSVELSVKDWYGALDVAGITVTANDTELISSNGDIVYIEDNELNVLLNDDETVKTLNYVYDLEFEKDGTSGLIKCIITYGNTDLELSGQTFSFLLNRRT